MTSKARVSSFRSSFDSISRFTTLLDSLTQSAKLRALESGKEYRADDGIIGKVFEIVLREYIQPFSKRNNERVTSSRSSYCDMRIGNAGKVEIKSACGELGEGTEFSDILPKADYVIYCPEVDVNIAVENQSFVFTREQFIDMLKSYPGSGSVVRFGKSSTSGATKIAIQSFYAETRKSASKKIANHLWECCYERPTVAEWVNE